MSEQTEVEMKLDSGTLHLMRLAAKGADGDGWAPVSSVVWPLLARIPEELLERRPENGGGFARLTEKGEAVVFYS